MFNPDYITYPNALELSCYQVDVGKGEMIYYPENYWHQTMNMNEYTVSVSGTLVTNSNKLKMQKEFTRECTNENDKGNRIFGYEKDLCDGLDKAFDIWRNKDWEGDIVRDMEVEKEKRGKKETADGGEL